MNLLVIVYSILIFIITCCVYIYVKLVRRQKYVYDTLKAQGIPGEPFVPIIGQISDALRADKEDRGVEYFRDLSKKFGDHYLCSLGPIVRFVVINPDLIGEVLGRTKGGYYRKPKELNNIVKSFIGEHNLLVSEDKEHERARKMLNPAFHFVNLRSMVSIMSNETLKAIQTLLSSTSETTKIRVDSEFNVLTLSIIASSAFGRSFDVKPDGDQSLADIFNEIKDIVAYRTIRLINQNDFIDRLPFWGRPLIDKGSKLFNDFVDQSIQTRRTGESTSLCSGSDILDLLLSAVDDNGQSFTDQQIKDEALTFVLAGSETTGNLMTWTIYLLMHHEQVLKDCREEIDRVLGNETSPTFEHLADLQIIEAVLYESLRLYPPAPIFVRECKEPHRINTPDNQQEIYIPTGTHVLVSVYTVHRNEKYWSNPNEFNYKRWLRDPVTKLKPKLSHPYAFIPFAQGTRNCIGQNFAILEAKVILAMFLQQCDFQLIPGQVIVPESKGVTMSPKYGMYANIKKRK